MQKQELIRTLMSAIELEENHSQFVVRFFLENFDWQKVDEEKVERVKKILETIRSQTSNHERMLNEIIEYVNQSGENEV
jgi:hypothetical protein